MKLHSWNNTATHIRTEQNSPSLLKSLANLSFNFLMNRHDNIQHFFKSTDIVRKQQRGNPPGNTKYISAALSGRYQNSLFLLFCLPAFPQAGIGKLRLCHYHQYLNGLHQQIEHQYDPVSPLVVLEWTKGPLDQDLNVNNTSVTNPGVCFYRYKQDTYNISEHCSSMTLHFPRIITKIKPSTILPKFPFFNLISKARVPTTRPINPYLWNSLSP